MFMKLEKYEAIIKNRLSEKRYIHSVNVAKEAVKLAEKHGADVEKAYIAGILHDICKEESPQNQLQIIEKYGITVDSYTLKSYKLYHAKAGAAFIKGELLIEDEDIINAVLYHTTAREGMSLLEKIIYLADYIGEDRDYNGVDEMRRETEKSLLDGMIYALKFTMQDLAGRELVIHPDTFNAYNQYITEKRGN